MKSEVVITGLVRTETRADLDEIASPTAVTCPKVGEGLVGYAPEPKFALRVSTF